MCKAVIILALMLGGCATQHLIGQRHAIVTPSGNKGHVIWCKFDEDCWLLASEGCPQGYTILNNESQDGWAVNGFAHQGTMSLKAGNKHKKSMVVECKYHTPLVQSSSTGSIVRDNPF